MTASTTNDGALIPRATASDVLQRIETELRTGDAASFVLATDADDTLWDGDVGVDIFEAFLAKRGARPEAEEALRREAEAHGVAVTGGRGAHEAASALYAAFGAETYPEDRAFAMMAWAFAGWSVDELGAFADEVLDARGLDARIRPALRSILDAARAHGVEIFVVSASPRAVVERGVARLGVAPERVLAMTPALRGGRVVPELAAPATYGDGKVRALHAALSAGAGAAAAPRSVLAAFGDSRYDAELLREARVPVAVTPSPKLLAVAGTIPGLVVLSL